ncbi:LYR motif-containing protein 4 [Lethenteron reissneri]|uniref:LYR motif-containing protein 4 n=1 Tax=Lethenteron reissneri TaxID=7753 RepID=UPI002AB6EFF4|nr:LYR motif-containing protein 4 [Lethenteron reissneri]
MAAPSRTRVLALYKALLRESGRFASYSYREYALRRVKDAFQENRTLQEPEKVASLMARAQESLDVIRRQVVVGNLYSVNKLVVEGGQ